MVPVPEDVSSRLKDTFEAVGLSKNLELAELPKHSDLKQVQHYFTTGMFFINVDIFIYFIVDLNNIMTWQITAV